MSGFLLDLLAAIGAVTVVWTVGELIWEWRESRKTKSCWDDFLDARSVRPKVWPDYSKVLDRKTMAEAEKELTSRVD